MTLEQAIELLGPAVPPGTPYNPATGEPSGFVDMNSGKLQHTQRRAFLDSLLFTHPNHIKVSGNFLLISPVALRIFNEMPSDQRTRLRDTLKLIYKMTK